MALTFRHNGQAVEYTGAATEGMPPALTIMEKEKRSQFLDSADCYALKTSISEAEMVKGMLKASTRWVLTIIYRKFFRAMFSGHNPVNSPLATQVYQKSIINAMRDILEGNHSMAYRVPAVGRFTNLAFALEKVIQN